MDIRIEKLNEIHHELFELANSYAGDTTGTVAGNLHNAADRVADCIRMLEEGITTEDSAKLMTEWLLGKPELLEIMSRCS